MASITQIVRQRQQAIILALMLEMLHLSIWLDFGSPLSRSLMLVHLGLFLIWQPVWRGDVKLVWQNGLLFIMLTVAFVTWMNWLLLFGWLILLTGFCGGRSNIHRQERYINLIVLVFLTSELLIPCTVALFYIETSLNVFNAFGFFLPILPLLVILIPANENERSLDTVDFIQATTTALLISLLVVGSLLNMYRGETEYFTSLIETLITIGLFLFVISWLLSPHAGFSGLSLLWTRSILNIGTPLEQWLEQIANLFEQQNSPEEFLAAVLEEIIALPWVSGTVWHTHKSNGEFGEITKYETEINTDNFVIKIYSHAPVGGALFLHCKLLVQIIDNFYEAKLREKKLTHQTHLQAIYETGARVTHDIKNLLQSLHAITSITTLDSSSDEKTVSQIMLEKQLPLLTQRLQLALDKLQAPEITPEEPAYAKDWWRELQSRNNLPGIEFQSDISGDPIIPVELFDSVIENLLENIRVKRQVEPDITALVTLYSAEDSIILSICDNGSQIPEELENTIFIDPVKSDTGLGVGLYQVAKQAESNSYTLSLTNNQNGRVCFELKTLANGK
jgi:signal transduction histidine kinase